ncbi:hypothetical protein BLS_003974 [Venturia inaequalis]|uniref:Copper acquisition factor BIM1-like domain-containing protein n=1 Tax=Venturia inaequalis TaxID=5025 RepID=A0A8H3VGP2_VENIN|nr:hypothetical protein BLS_003974 [Venturia inaequalis]KAE9987411.1 hypothetical protein EG328_002767 [Venturia inaequalis]KAE9994322.1 hypothetical protein EG327_011424 [Venturia inaequalis]RDI87010.1 hypothetical protein Vi05172_g3242 [Venturia inaequalis]
MSRISILLALAACWNSVAAHLVISYPGWRGNNLKTSGLTEEGTVPPGSLGQNYNNKTGEYEFPYGMQWMYPCGGLPVAQNRTKWPVTGGALSFQPGWFNGHQTAFIYVNIGIGNEPLNYSHPMVPVFQLTGPVNAMYPGTFCLPQVPLPANISYNIGDNATIQIVETAVHGAALYSCVDITFAEQAEVAQVNSSNCFNSSGTDGKGGPMGMNFVYTATGLTAGAARFIPSSSTLATILGTSLLALFL